MANNWYFFPPGNVPSCVIVLPSPSVLGSQILLSSEHTFWISASITFFATPKLLLEDRHERSLKRDVSAGFAIPLLMHVGWVPMTVVEKDAPLATGCHQSCECLIVVLTRSFALGSAVIQADRSWILITSDNSGLSILRGHYFCR
ncbi:hypothetical protein KC361_g68 [Hortaea werneckii]|nr:hypothetical protein KC361_g68 [Hortaea werneckii]